MTRVLTDGFEHQKIAATAAEYGGVERAAVTGAITWNTSTPRTGEACLSAAPSAVNTAVYSTLGGATGRAWFVKFGLRFNAAPVGALDVMRITTSAAALLLAVRLTTTPTLRFVDSAAATVTPVSVTLSTGTWYVVEVAVTIPAAGNTTAQMRIYDNTDVLLDSFTSASASYGTTAPDQIRIGRPSGTEASATILIDDLCLNDSQGATDNTWVGPTRVDFAWPTSDSAVGTGWLEADGTTDALYSNVDNRPPVGVAATPTTGATQIKNASASASALNYDANVESYTTVGAKANDTILGTRMLARGGGSSTTGTNDALLRVVSNPADAGDTTATGIFDTAVVAETTAPTTWRTLATPRAVAPSVTKGTQPVIRIGKNANATRVHQVDQMALEVEWRRAALGSVLNTDTEKFGAALGAQSGGATYGSSTLGAVSNTIAYA